MKSFAYLLVLLAAFFSAVASAQWTGLVINKCGYPLYAKTTRQIDPDGLGLDSKIVEVPANGGTYSAAWLPQFGNGEDLSNAGAKGVTIKLEKANDPGFVTGHVYQIEYTPYWYKTTDNKKLSADLSVVDGNPLANVNRYLAITVGGAILDLHRCESSITAFNHHSVLLCEAGADPCLYEWQRHHERNVMPADESCPPMNTKPECSHPIECSVGEAGQVQFTACA
ncbi:BYS1 domain protein [Neofusicoccum parvum]|nr:BYS1 domain protein [Neofusicoccum parvum]